MEDVPSTYLSGQDDVDNLSYPLPSIGQNEACAPMPCPGGVEIVLVGGGEANIGAYPEEGGVLTSYPHMGYREDNREGIRLTHSRDSDGINCGIMGRPDQDHHSSSKYTLPPPDHRTLHRLGSHHPGTLTTPWGYSASDAHEEDERESDGMTSEDQYLQNRRYEWSSSLDEVEGHSQLMMIRSDPPPINMPAFRRALQLGRAHEAWQGGNYSEEDAHVEVEEEEEEEEGSVYTCIECNIYFKKKAHLLEHMFQHSQEGEGEGLQAGEGSYTCGECGKAFGDEESLDCHRQLHQESRQKIIEEISKLENIADEGRDARLQCPKCLFGTNSSKVFVQHAKTHVRKASGEARGNPTSFRTASEMLEGGETSEMANEAMWKSPDAEATIEQGWRSDTLKPAVQGPSKVKRKILTREDSENSMHERVYTEGEIVKSTRASQLPEAAVKLKNRFRVTLRSGGEREEEQTQQLKDQVAVVVLERIDAKKKKPKGSQSQGSGKKLTAGNKGLLSRYERHLTRDDWGEVEEDVSLDALLMDPKYASQLEALGLRSEERECPYCPDRFHNGIGLANHVRGHLNRVGVSYNVRHFISAEEVKAIEQNYSFQKKRKKVANFDPSTFSLMRCEFCGAGFDTRAGLSSHARAHLRDFGITNWELTVSPIHVLARLLARSPGRPLPPFPPWHQDTDTDALSDEDDGTPLDLGRPQISKPDQGRVEKMASDQSGDKTEESKGPGPTTCELCGACFETRKGLSSHARSHLRHLGVPESESSGAPIDLLNELAKQGKLPKDESVLGAKKVASSQPGSPKAQWGEEDGPLNLTVEGETSKENDCQFCGAWFETRKGLSSHARAHLRHLGVTDLDKGHPITTLNALVKSEEFKKRLASGQVSANDDGLKASVDGTAKESGTDQSPPNVKEASLFTKSIEGTDKENDDSSSDESDSSPISMPVESPLKLSNSTGPIETSAHFKCPSGSGNSTQIKIVEAGAPHILASDVHPHTKLMEAGGSRGKPVPVHHHGKMESSNHPKHSLTGLHHPRPSPSHTPPTKQLKMSPSPCKPNMEAYWSPKNVSTPLNLCYIHTWQFGCRKYCDSSIHLNGACRNPHTCCRNNPVQTSGTDPVTAVFCNISAASPSSEEVRCEFCGEFFENRKGLSSHARSHLRQMGVTEWHVNGSPIDTLREILATGSCPRSANRIGGPNSNKLLSHHPPSSPSGSHPFSGLSPTMHRKPPRLPTFTASEWPADLSPLNLSSRADPTRDIRCEFCNEFFENRKGLSSHARSHLRQMGVTEWHVNGSPIDTLREIIRKRRPLPQQSISTIKKEPRGDDEPPSPTQRLSPLGIGSQGMARDLSISPHGRSHDNFLSPMPAKRPLSHGPRQPDPRGYVNIEPKTCNQPKSYMHGEPRPKSYIQDDGRPKTFIQSDGRTKTFLPSADGRPKTFLHEGRPKGFLTGEHRPKAFLHGEHKPKVFLQGDGRPKPYLPGDGKPKHFMHGDSKPKVYSPDGKPKAYIQTELPFKVKVKSSPEKTVASLEACCELCGLFFENRKALASHARAHLRQFGVTEWCVNGSPIETLREWMKQRPQKAGAYLSYIQGGRPYTKKFKRALQSPKPGVTERESPAVIPGKLVEAERIVGAQGAAAEKPSEVHGHKTEPRQPKPTELPPAREETVPDHTSKAEEPRPPVRARPVPSLVPRPPQTSLVKFVGNIYTLKCRFCDIQFHGPLSIQEQWVRHLQHHILEMNFSKASSPPHALSSEEQQPEPAKAQ